MIRILLVDDEPFFHSMFVNLVDWQAFGCCVAYHAENGREAIDILAQHPVDVLFTDMVMPIVNGVELIRYVRKEYPKVVCIALSSFDDFVYVRDSLKEGARDYLLKHMLTRPVLEEFLRSLADGMAKRADASNASAADMTVFAELFVKLLKETSEGEDESAALSKIIRETNVDFPEPPLLAVCVHIHEIAALYERFVTRDRFLQFLAMAVNITQSALESYGRTLCFSNGADTIYAAVSNERFASGMFSIQTAQLLKRSLSSILHRYCNIDVLIEAKACEPGGGGRGIIDAFLELEKRISMQIGAGMLREPDAGGPVISLSFEVERAILHDVQEFLFDDAERLIRDEFENLRARAPQRRAMRHMALEFVNLLHRICREKEIDLNLLFVAELSPYAMIEDISSFPEMEAYVVRAYRALFASMQQSANPRNAIVQSALSIILNQYGEDISLTSVAEQIRCNPSYLSRVFKAETGKGFLQYLTTYRLHQACALMKKRKLSLQEIAKRTGFASYSYFFKIFKQYMGTTPRSYMERGGAPVEEQRKPDEP